MKTKSVKLLKKSHLPKQAGVPKPIKAGEFILVDNEDDTCTVMGVDAAGNPVDIGSVATLTPAPVSSDTTILTVDPPSGMTFKMIAVGPLGFATVTATAAWNDGSTGPFSADLPVQVIAGTPTGVKIIPGVPVPH